MWEWLEKIVIIFTEEMNPKGIWKDAGEPVTAKHEKFELFLIIKVCWDYIINKYVQNF